MVTPSDLQERGISINNNNNNEDILLEKKFTGYPIIIMPEIETQLITTMYESDPMIKICKNILHTKIFEDMSIEFGSDIPFIEMKKKSMDKWSDFLEKSLNFIHKFGCVPWIDIFDTNKMIRYPSIPDLSLGKFVKILNPETYKVEMHFISNDILAKYADKKKMFTQKTLEENRFKVFSDPRQSFDLYGLSFNTLISALRKDFYENLEKKENNLKVDFNGANPTCIAERADLNINWNDLTEGQVKDPGEENALQLVENMAEKKGREGVINLANFANTTSRNEVSRIRTNKGNYEEFIGRRSFRAGTLPIGYRFSGPVEYRSTGDYLDFLEQFNRQVAAGFGLKYDEILFHSTVKSSANQELIRTINYFKNLIKKLYLNVYESMYKKEYEVHVLKKVRQATVSALKQKKDKIKREAILEKSWKILNRNIKDIPFPNFDIHLIPNVDFKIDEIVKIFQSGMITVNESREILIHNLGCDIAPSICNKNLEDGNVYHKRMKMESEHPSYFSRGSSDSKEVLDKDKDKSKKNEIKEDEFENKNKEKENNKGKDKVKEKYKGKKKEKEEEEEKGQVGKKKKKKNK